MLTVYVDKNDIPSELEIVDDVETEFLSIKLNKSEAESQILFNIEEGEYLDPIFIKDRFGAKLSIADISTGCKSALCVLNNHNKVINMIEAGLNAVSVILRYCSDGHILLHDCHIGYFDFLDNGRVSIKMDNYLFDNVARLDKYLADERPFKPHMGGGIYHV